MRDLEQHKKQEDSPPREMTVEEFYRRKCLKAEAAVERLRAENAQLRRELEGFYYPRNVLLENQIELDEEGER